MGSTPPSSRPIKREPLAPTTCSSGNNNNSSEPPLRVSTPSVIKKEPVLQLHKLPAYLLQNNRLAIKPEPVSDKEASEDDGDELAPPDPNKPKTYKRIRKVNDESDEEGKGDDATPTRKEGGPNGALEDDSDDDDEYVPLVSGSRGKGDSSSGSLSGSDDNTSKKKKDDGPASKSSRSQRQRGSQSVPKPSGKTMQKPKPKSKKKGVKTRRQRAAAKRDDSDYSPSSDVCSVISETQSLDGFIVSDDEPASDPDDLDTRVTSLSELSDQKRLRSTQAKAKKKTRKKVRPKRKKDSSTSSSDDETGSEQESQSQSRRKPPPRHKSKPSSSTSSESASPPQKKKKQELRNDVVNEMRTFMPSCVGVSSRPRRKRNPSAAALVHGDDSHNEDGGGDSGDSFIDNSNKVDTNWNMESSSESDQEVVEEDPSILELDSDTFAKGTSSSSSGKDDSSSEDKSQSSSEDEERIRVRKNIFEHGPEKCDLCINLADVDLRHRETQVDESGWCKCEECKVVSPKMTNYDRICCKEIRKVQDFIHDEDGKRPKCITDHPKFKKYVLEYGAFLRSRNKKGNTARNKLRDEFRRCTDHEKVAKCKESFLKWIFRKVEWTSGIPMTVPACVVARIRWKHAKNAGPLYFDPFRVTKVCKFGTHCSNAKNNV